MGLTADRRLYLTTDRLRVVEENDPAEAFLLVGAGSELSKADAATYGISVGEDGRLIVGSVETKEAETHEDKEDEGPAEDKQLVPPENKRRAPVRRRRSGS